MLLLMLHCITTSIKKIIMKNIGIITVILCIFISTCDNDITPEPISRRPSQKPVITLDFDALSAKKSLSEKEKKYSSEVVYSAFKRAYEHIKIEDGLYVLNIKDGKDIQISQKLFNMIKGSIDDANKEIIRLRLEGYDYSAAEGATLSPPSDWDWDKLVKMYQLYNSSNNEE